MTQPVPHPSPQPSRRLVCPLLSSLAGGGMAQGTRRCGTVYLELGSFFVGMLLCIGCGGAAGASGGGGGGGGAAPGDRFDGATDETGDGAGRGEPFDAA